MNNKQIEKLKSYIKDFEKRTDYIIGLNQYIDTKDLEDLKNLEELKDYFYQLDNINQITNIKAIYHYNTINYLAENDPSLQNSINIALELGYKLKNINSEILASLLQSQEARDEYDKFINNLENLELFED